MRAAGVLLLLLLAPGAPALQDGPDVVTAGDGTVLVRWTADAPGDLSLDAGSISGTLVDTYAQDRLDVDHEAVASVTGAFHTETRALPAGPGHLSLLRSEAATLLVLPLSGSFQATLAGTPLGLRHVEEEVLERSHAYDSVDDPDVHDGSDYAYRVHDVVAAEGRGPVRVEVRGDFLLYVWNATVLQETPERSEAHTTGQWSTEGTTPLHRTDHHQHALVVVRDGHLRLGSPLGGALYAPELLLHDAPAGEPVDAAGLVSAAAGTLRATPGDGRVVLTAAPAPAPPPAAEAASWWFLAPLAAVGVVATPNLLGLRSAGRGAWPGALRMGHGAVGRLRQGRAAGYCRLALAAERGYRFRRAALWMGCAARWGQDPELRVQQAVYLRMAGLPGRALRRHRAAEEMFRMEGFVHALNAYEAARSAALVGRADEALQWLLVAVREEPWLARRAPFEPDLAPLRSLPAFMDLAQAADPDGFLSP